MEIPTRSLMLVIGSADAIYARRLNLAQFAKVFIRNVRYITWTEARMEAKRLGCDCIATTQFPFFCTDLEGSQEDNIGTLVRRDGLEVLYIPELYKLYSDATMPWLMNRFLAKLHSPEQFVQPDTFQYREVCLADVPRWLRKFDAAHAAGLFVAVDIETKQEGAIITSCSWTVVQYDPVRKRIFCESAVLQISGENSLGVPNYVEAFKVVGAFNSHPIAKCFHRGIYDNAYFIRFGVPPVNWVFDTYNLQHSIYPELRKTLAACTQIYCHTVRFWKEMSSYAKLEYNARDTHYTAWVLLGILHHIRQDMVDRGYALTNYTTEFPLNFPSLHCSLEGLAVNLAERERLRMLEETKAEAAVNELRQLLGVRWFNPGSYKQVNELFLGMGFVADSTDKKAMQAFTERGPLEQYLAQLISKYRKASKAVSTYFTFKLLDGRFLYEIDPAGTETGRMASNASQFWVGTQIQNMPGYSKSQCIVDAGYEFGSVDGSQAESRCTAYLSQDVQLMRTVETSPDFHCTNASLFFGVPFKELYSIEPLIGADGKPYHVLRKDIRGTAKRVNHGANYNMGAFVLWETMGTREVFNAARLLKLPKSWGVIEICRHLLVCFCNAYPDVKGRWYGEVQQEVMDTGRLVGPTGWVRRTFLRPNGKDKPALNACVAHPPQSLSVMIVNKVFYKSWRLQMTEYRRPDGGCILRLKAQIHDEVFFQYATGREDIPVRLGAIFENTTVQVHGRTLRIPADPKYGAMHWGELKE